MIEKYIGGRRCAILGLGVSHTPLARLLNQKNISLTVYDGRTAAELGKEALELEKNGVSFVVADKEFDGVEGEIIFRSPGIRPDVPEIAAAVAGGSVLTSEMEIFLAFCPCKVYAITGSDGKTTTTTLVSELLKKERELGAKNGKVYLGGGTYDGGWNSAPPMSVYDTASGTWGNVDFTVKMYEALDADSTTKKWYELPATSSSSNNVAGGIKNISVTTDCEISNFRFINGKPMALGADSINGNTWADGTVSTSTTTTQKYVANNLGNYNIVFEDFLCSSALMSIICKYAFICFKEVINSVIAVNAVIA